MSWLSTSRATSLPSVSPPVAGYTLVFADEFTNFVGDPNGVSGWMTQLAFGDGRTRAGNSEAEYYCDTTVAPFINPFSINGSVLQIAASLASVTGANALSLPYNSGSISSYNSFYMTYGWFEISCKIPPGTGLWPAFWLVARSGNYPPEIDIMEQIGVATTIYQNIHYDPTNLSTGPAAVTVADTTAAFHKYAIDWEPNFTTFYVDGVQTNQYATPTGLNSPNEPMCIYCNLAVGGAGSWPGQPSGTTFPAVMLVDYIRCWSSPNTVGLGGTRAQ